MIEHLDGSTQQPRQFIITEDGDQTLNPAFLIWRKKDKALLTLLLSTLSSPVLAMVVGWDQPHQEVWNRLEEKFTCTARANNTRDKLSAVGVLVDNEELLHMILKGLPKEFAPFASAIRTRDNNISFEKLSVLLQTEEQSMAVASESFSNSALAMFVSNNHKPNNGFNGGQGYNRGRGRNSFNRGRGGRSFNSYPSQHQTQLPQLSNPTSQPSSQPGSQANASTLNTQTPYQGTEQVTVGNGQNLPIQSIVHKLCLDNNCSCHFDAQKLLIQDLPTGRLLYKGLSKDGVYPINSSQFCTSASSKTACLASSSAQKWELWHSRLGHPSAKFIALVKTQFQHSVQLFRTDCGGEFISTEFNKFCADNGIIHQLSCPHTPQQNGVAERKHRHLIQCALALLSQSNLPISYWSYAVSTAAHLINKLPTPLLSNKSPWESLFHTKPTLTHLRAFGCQCFPLLTPYNKNKLQPKSVPCIFIANPIPFPKLQPFPLTVGLATLLSLHSCTHIQVSSSASLDSNISDRPISPWSSTLSNGSPQSLLPADLSSVPISDRDPSTLTSNAIPPLPITSPATSNIPLPTVSPDIPNLPLNTATTNPATSNPNPTAPHTTSQHPMQTRSKSGIFKPKLGYAAHIDYNTIEPPSYKIAAQHPQWCTAMQEEFAALQQQGTWSLVLPLPHQNVVGYKWVYKLKHNSDGAIARYKARLVAKGFHQQQGVDYAETFSPVVKPPTVRLILSLAVSHNWPLQQLDVKNAFLHGTLKEEVYMAQPQGYIDSSHPHYVCWLHKSIYGLKQAPRAWFESFTTQLLHLGFIASTADSSLVHLPSTTMSLEPLMLFMLLRPNMPLIYWLSIKWLIPNQQKHPAVPTLVSLFMKVICSLILMVIEALLVLLHYLTFTRPDISFAVHQVCQYMAAPTTTHLSAAKRILRYIKGTLFHGIAFTPGPLTLSVYSDADWAGDPDDRRSTSGLLVYLGSNPITWSAKKQATVSRSSTESEYRALANCLLLRSVGFELCSRILAYTLSQPPILWCDNVSALAIASNPVFHARTKHIELADIFTKSLPTQRFLDLQRNLTVSVRPHSIEGG
uniref:Integrase catalytic domain-containing protein n=1 Tax=Fagus sylvatica TaxID=28930 RepID=A0A2N9H8A2_FAGSY